jgi:hypothetical protein
MKVGASGLALEGTGRGAAAAKESSETVCRVNILTNQVGYLTHGGKKFLVESNVHSLKPDFYLHDLNVTRCPARPKMAPHKNTCTRKVAGIDSCSPHWRAGILPAG